MKFAIRNFEITLLIYQLLYNCQYFFKKRVTWFLSLVCYTLHVNCFDSESSLLNDLNFIHSC